MKKMKMPAFYKGWKKWLIDILVIVIVFIALRAYQTQDIHQGEAIPVTGQLLDQQPIDWQQYRGKPLVLHFWATWCPICKFEEDTIQSLSEDYQVLTISSWSEDTADYLQQQQLTFKTLDDPEGEWAIQYGVKAVPATFIINGDGIIEFIESGYSSEIGLRLRLWWLGI